ncbi:MAG: pentapeptide repeat-containing protein [Candidatus Thiodiazotropha lotti]|nr:pentapeptide repeat-containing protein [Candidatus Thiodiazotropha lotti]
MSNYDHFSLSALVDIIKSGEKSFKHVDFSGMALATIALKELEFIDCLFDHTNFSKNDLNELRFVDCSLNGALLTGSLVNGCTFEGCNLKEASFNDARLQETSFNNTKIKEADFSNAEIDGYTISTILRAEVTLKRAFVTNASISGITTSSSKLIDCMFTEVTFNNVQFNELDIINCRFPLSTFKACSFSGEGKGCQFNAVNFSMANFEKTSFDNIELDNKTRFYRATMDVKSLASIIKNMDEVQGIKLVTESSDIPWQNLTPFAQLGETTYINCDFSQTNLANAWLYKSRFFNCNFKSAHLAGANLILSQFHQCDLSSACLHYLRLHAALFRDCDCRHSDWHSIDACYPAFYNCDFSYANGNWDKKEPYTSMTGSYAWNRERTRFKGQFSQVNFLDHQNAFNCTNFDTQDCGVFITPSRNDYTYRYDKFPGTWDISAHAYRDKEFGTEESLSASCKNLRTKSRELFLKMENETNV